MLVETGHSRHWGTDAYAENHPFLTAAAADWLVDNGAALVGIDSLNIDGTHTGERPVHTRLLAAGIPVVEHLTGLDALPPTGFRFSAPPPKVAGFGHVHRAGLRRGRLTAAGAPGTRSRTAGSAGHAAEPDEAPRQLDLAHVAQSVLVDPALERIEHGDALGSGDAGAVACRRRPAAAAGAR